MLKIVYRVCCGMDVHKSFVVSCIAATNEQGVTTYKSKRFSTFTGDLRRCAAWLAENNCKDVCMESTGKYWIPIYNILEHTCNIVLAHPKYVKAIRGKKTDKRDAKWIADIFKHDLVAGSFIPPPDIRQLRDLVRYRWKLTNFTTGEKNRAQNCLTVSNFKLDDVFSDVFGKAASAITARILEDPTEKITDISGFRTKGMKATDEQVLAAVDGEMCAEQAEKLRIIRSHMDSLELCKLNLESLILSTAEKYLPQFNLVMSAPGIQSFAAIGIISEIGVDMSAKQRECRQEENHQNQSSRSLHQALAGAMRALCHSSQAVPGSPQPLSRSQKAPGTQESHYRNCQDAPYSYLQYAQEK